jgi:elongation factor Ts
VAQLVKQLRDATGAPMMECKKALSDPSVDNDISKAMEWLRKYGSAKALSKVSGREALEGLVGIHIINNNTDTTASRLPVASIVRVASETDFASRSHVLSLFVQDVATAAAASAATADTSTPTTVVVEDIPSFLKQTKVSSSSCTEDNNNKTLDQCLSDTILAIRENLQVDCITTLHASTQQSIFGGYVHGRASPASTCGSAASIVELVPIVKDTGSMDTANSSSTSDAETVARKLAMHVVAAKPTYLTINTVPSNIIAKEKEILHDKMISDGKTDGKTPEIIDKIIQGQLRKYYESVCLTEQIHMIEEGSSVKVSKVLSDLGLEVKSFQLVGLGK